MDKVIESVIESIMKFPPNPSTRISLLLAIPLALASLSLLALGQSGRTQSQNPAKPTPTVKPVPPVPIPTPRPEGHEQKSEAIRINSDLVTVVTSVGVVQRGLAGALQREDFEVLEDGVAQEIVNFAHDADVPLRMVMLFDTSSSVAQRITFERRAAARFFERVMRSHDQAALFSVATDVSVLQDFTSKVPLLVNATKQLQAKGATSLYDAIFLAADYLRAAPGRHIIVIVSDGGDTTSAKELKQALAEVQLADAVIFAVFTGNVWPSENLRDLAAERALATLTAETGGEVFVPKPPSGTREGETDEQSLNYLDATFTKLAEQLRTQYIIGFYSTNEAHDGRFRKLTVQIKKPGYTARARSGYYAPKS
jgi:Ca-activated chloride channel family protein